MSSENKRYMSQLTESFWGLIGVAVRDGEPILCEVGATPLGVLFGPV